MSTKSIRILVQFNWPEGAVTRLWDGAGLFVDSDGNTWRGSALQDDLDAIEQAINGEAYTLNMSLTGVGSAESDLAWLSYAEDEIIGAVVQISIQPCNGYDEPIGAREVMFTGRIDNVLFDEGVQEDRRRSTITVEVVNRFTLRRVKSDRVLSDADQRARSAAVNPTANPDRFCERVPLIEDRTITWPRFTS